MSDLVFTMVKKIFFTGTEATGFCFYMNMETLFCSDGIAFFKN